MDFLTPNALSVPTFSIPTPQPSGTIGRLFFFSLPAQTFATMHAKSILFFIFFILLLFSFSIFLGTIDPRSYFFPSFQLPSVCAPPDPPLKVFMYDLPPRFNVAMLNRRTPFQNPVTVSTWPPWPKYSGLKKQHSVEYWMMGSLLSPADESGAGREAVRVLDPEMADVFFVPFFSSLSFNTHGRNMTDPDTEIDHQLQIDLLKILQESKFWQRSGGRDHVIPLTHPNAFRFLRQHVNASILIVVDFGRYPKTMSNLEKDVVSPYVHVVSSFVDDGPQDPYESRTTLLFFQGRTFRKDEGIIRVKLAKILAGYDDVHYERSAASTESIEASSRGMRSSKFCLHPAGDTPSSCRLFDAIVSHCVPVIVSDRIELPYESEIDYGEFSLFFSFDEALEPGGYMVDKLRQIPKERWIQMWGRLKNISNHFEFQYPPRKEDAVNMLWRQVKQKVPKVKLGLHRRDRLKIPDWWQRRK